jgi:photosystem II stability/assembly factor-like uncharacterized protein
MLLNWQDTSEGSLTDAAAREIAFARDSQTVALAL